MPRIGVWIFCALSLLLLCYIPGGLGYKILFTTPVGGSHLMGKLTVGKALIARGHEVHLVVSDKYPKIDSITKTGIKPLLYTSPEGSFQVDSEDGLRLLSDVVFSGQSPIVLSKMFSKALMEECEYLMEDKTAIEKVKSLKFDLVIAEPFILCPCAVLLPAHLGIPMVTLAAFFDYLDIRLPVFPSFAVGSALAVPLLQENLHKHTLLAKLKALPWFFAFLKLDLIFPGQSTALLEKYAPQYTSWGEIVRESMLFLSEVDFRLGNYIPVFPNYISVAGMTTSPAKPLPQDLEQIMKESGSHGVVVLSFGSSAYYMPQNTVRKFLEAFSQINQTVLVRFNVPDGLQVPKNVKVVSWMPQNDLLGHSSTRLFITHCGNSGQYEALYHGVPMIGMPWFAEQHANCQRTLDRGFSLTFSILDFTPEELASGIKDVLYNKKYGEAIGRASAAWKDELKLESPLDRAGFWIEHVIKYGGKHLRSPAMELSLFEFLMLDVICFVIVSVLVISALAYSALRCVYRRLKSLKGLDSKKKDYSKNEKAKKVN